LRPPKDAWFRFTTRVRAVSHWLREKGQFAGDGLATGADAFGSLWNERSRTTRRRVVAVLATLGLYALIKFAPLGFPPCEPSAANECAPGDEVTSLASKDALLYAHLTLDRDSHQYELVSDFAEEFPDLQLFAAQLSARLPTPSGSPIEIDQDVLPWAEGDLAVEVLPAPPRSQRAKQKDEKGEKETKAATPTTTTAFLIGVGDRDGAEEFIARIAPRGKARQIEQGEVGLRAWKGGFAAAYADDQLIVGDEPAVRASLRVANGAAPGLEDSPAAASRDALPEARFAEIVLSRAGVKRLLSPNAAGASQLDTFVDYGATTGFAASASAGDEGIELDLVSDLDPKLLKQSPTVFANLPQFEPGLVSEAGESTLAYVGVGDLGPTLSELVGGAGGGDLARSLRALSKGLQKEAKVNPLRDLLPALRGEAALVAEPTDAVPFASLIVDGVDEDAAAESLAKLQGPVLKALKGSTPGQIRRFEEREIDGVATRSVPVSGTVELAYAVFDGKLVVSTDPEGIAQVRQEGGGLADSMAFERATDDLPEVVSALVFLNLDELLGLAEQAGLAEDPTYASLSDDLDKIESLALAVSATDNELRSELFVAID